MLQTEELKGVRDDRGHWYVEQHEVHRLMEERREAASQETRESPQSAAEFIEIVRDLERGMGRFESRLELTERAESTVQEERDRLLAELEEVRDERRRLQEELENSRRERSWWRKLFRG